MLVFVLGFRSLPGPAQHPAVLPRLRLAQVRVRRHHVGVHSDRRQLHGGAVCATRRGILPKVLQVRALVRVTCHEFLLLLLLFLHNQAQLLWPISKKGGVGGGGAVFSATQRLLYQACKWSRWPQGGN